MVHKFKGKEKKSDKFKKSRLKQNKKNQRGI